MDTNQGRMTQSVDSQITEDTINRLVDHYLDSNLTTISRDVEIATINDSTLRYDPSAETITYAGQPINGDWWTRSSTISCTKSIKSDFDGFSNILEKCKEYLKEKLKDLSYDIIGINLKDFGTECDKSRIIDIALEIPTSDDLISYISVIVNENGDILPYEPITDETDTHENEGD